MLQKAKVILMNQEGQGLVEYGVIIALIAVVAIGALILLGPTITEKFFDVQKEIKNAKPASAGGGGGGGL